jgi:hypothetical protein
MQDTEQWGVVEAELRAALRGKELSASPIVVVVVVKIRIDVIPDFTREREEMRSGACRFGHNVVVGRMERKGSEMFMKVHALG